MGHYGLIKKLTRLLCNFAHRHTYRDKIFFKGPFDDGPDIKPFYALEGSRVDIRESSTGFFFVPGIPCIYGNFELERQKTEIIVLPSKLAAFYKK